MLGIYPTLSNEDYHKHDSISRSKLLDFAVSPFNYWALHLNPDRPKKEATPAMIMGSAFHAAILEPAAFSHEFAFLPEPVLLKDTSRGFYDERQRQIRIAKESGLPIVPMAMLEIIFKMKDALKAHPQAMQLIENAVYEQSYFWQDKESGLLVKNRPDIIHVNMGVDLKTCADASPRGIQNAMVTGGYHIQAAMGREAIRELEGHDIPNWILLCIEKTYPYAIGIYIIDEAALEAGRAKYKQLLVELKECLEKNEWQGYAPQSIGLPQWAQ